MQGEFNPEKLCADFMVLQGEVTALVCCQAMLTACRSVVNRFIAGDELAEISTLLEAADAKTLFRIKALLGLIDEMNRSGLQVIELLKTPAAGSVKQ